MSTADLDTEVEIRRHRGRSIFWGLLSAAVVLLICTMITHGDFPRAGFAVHLTLIVFLCTAAGLWLGLGQGWVRIPASMIASSGIGVILAGSSSTDASWLVVAFCLAITLVSAIATYVVRFFAGELAQASDAAFQDEKQLQFGIKHILIWTTLIALITPVVQRALQSSGNHDLQVVGVLALVYPLVAAIQIWMFMQRVTPVKMIGFGVFVIVVAAGLAWWLEDWMFWSSVTICSQILISCLLYCLRMQDYRFVPRV